MWGYGLVASFKTERARLRQSAMLRLAALSTVCAIQNQPIISLQFFRNFFERLSPETNASQFRPSCASRIDKDNESKHIQRNFVRAFIANHWERHPQMPTGILRSLAHRTSLRAKQRRFGLISEASNCDHFHDRNRPARLLVLLIDRP
jgi:hypothetical protein